MMLRFFLLLTLGAAALVFGLGTMLEATPRVAVQPRIATAQVVKARALLAAHDPRFVAPGTRRTLVLQQDDVDLLLGLAAQRFPRMAGRLRLGDVAAAGAVTFDLPLPGRRHYINLAFDLGQANDALQLRGLRVGGLRLPEWLARRLPGAARAWLRRDPDWGFAVDAVQDIGLDPGPQGPTLRIAYTVPAGVRAHLAELAVPGAEAARLMDYQAVLAQAVAAAPRTRALPLTALLPPVFALALERSRGHGAAAENRAALLVLAVYVSGRRLSEFLPSEHSMLRPAERKITLGGRDDFAQHLLVSAALASRAGGAFSDALGLSKELDDAREGSGFSFTDLAVDRAGTRLGTLAVADEAVAARLQAQLARPLQERTLLPALNDLPEFMPEAEFQRRFGGPGGAEYARVLRDIERRVDRLPILQPALR